MHNLYDNTFLREDKKKYNSIFVEQINECQPSFILAINNFFKILNESPELLYKIIKFITESDLTDSFLLFITNNLCVDILSPEIIPENFLLIIENILYDEISKISNITEGTKSLLKRTMKEYPPVDDDNFDEQIQQDE